MSTLTIDCNDCGHSYHVPGAYSEGKWWPDEAAIQRHDDDHYTCEDCGAVCHESRREPHPRIDCIQLDRSVDQYRYRDQVVGWIYEARHGYLARSASEPGRLAKFETKQQATRYLMGSDHAP